MDVCHLVICDVIMTIVLVGGSAMARPQCLQCMTGNYIVMCYNMVAMVHVSTKSEIKRQFSSPRQYLERL